MVAVVASVVAGAMKPLLTKLATLLGGMYNLSNRLKKEITRLEAEMSSMNAVLVRLSRMEELDEQQKDWRDKVRDLSYDMEDCVDIFTNDLDRGDAKGWFIRRLKKLKARYKLANRIEQLKAQAVEVSNRCNRYKIDEPNIAGPRGLVAIDPRIQALHAEAASLVGIDGQKKRLIELLTKEEEGAQRLKVVSVVGFGGMGKTTLANQVFSAIKSQFVGCTAFVSVSRNPNVVKILSDIYYKISGGLLPPLMELDEIINQIRECLEYHRYLIVIDDIWTEKEWNIIKCCFVENNLGSRVITTTRIEDVAQACCSCFHGHVHNIKSLDYLESRKLFHRRIFHSEDACPEQLKSVSDKILRKCDGVPLAILSVASILASNEVVNSKESWEKIQNYLCFHLEGRPSLELMRHVLNLGYKDLSLDLRTCMLYLGIYPEDSAIMKDDLVKRWVAEGFVTEKHGYGPEEIAEGYFSELINRNMIQIAEFDDCGDVLSCRVHDLMLEFIILKSAEENFISISKGDPPSMKGCLKVRRLSLQVGNSECNHVLGNMSLSQARSFNFWGAVQCMPSLSRFQLLRVLHLDVYESESKQYDLSSICNFFQLRYLRIRGIGSKKLLKQLHKLQHLQTLEMSPPYGIVDRVDVSELPLTLLHLIVPWSAKLLGDFGRMTALRSLADLTLDPEDVENIKSLGELANLRELKLSSYGVNRGRGIQDCLLISSLCKLGNLRSLTIGRRISDVDVLACWSPPPCHLRRLHVRYVRFSVVPDWIAQLDKLGSLEIAVLSLPTGDAEVLARLPFLVHLTLHVENDVPEEGIIIRGTEFRNLKEFSFRYKVLCLTFEAGVMPRLQSLHIECLDYELDARHDVVLAGIEHLENLKVFGLCIYKNHFGDFRYMSGSFGMTTLEAAIRKAINKHPGSPATRIITV